MTNGDAEHYRQRFLDAADTESLLEFVRLTGGDEQAYGEAVRLLAPVLEPLAFGEQPRYASLTPEALGRRRAEVEQIVQFLADSPKADARAAAVGTMAQLGWQTFTRRLAQLLASEVHWERLGAVEALGRIGGQPAIELLISAASDRNPEVSAAARRALAQRSPPES